ncbi:major facilitator superfamily domain-containing protein [Exophiala viscosa]|uniref:Major facilitator superfamily domain-containing protein n=1 Tax=Exophiala viscosa TaxID=2486360 RepID=A0AAN6DZ20_9EURO|nr:major facilitator superfamily domain-containing protein [Exophiala viscosa]KAI1624225.1 major facilitator superfamily domain-containing protein [Exophiala viscosa]
MSPAPPKPQAVSWASIPRKGQLAVIVFARLAEPLSERSLSSYLFYQLRWFDPSLSAAEIAKQAGYLTAVFAAAQCLTSMWWGYAADSPYLGRKPVLVVGMMGSAISALGMDFSRSLSMAFFFRFLAGALNGNVGVLRTMVSEVVVDKRYKARAFLLLPMCFNVGVIIGPLLSGFLADPVHSLPSIFGPGSLFGGKGGVLWMTKFPYALPNLMFAIILGTAALAIILGLDETHPQLRHQPDRGRRLGRLLVRRLLRGKADEYAYHPIHYDTSAASNARLSCDEVVETPANVCLTMLQRFLQSLHVSAFNSIFFSLLPAPRADQASFDLPFRFSGGLGLSSKKVGFANTTIGMIGLPLQLLLYPKLIGSIGVRNSYRVFLPLSIIAYVLLPYPVLLPDDVVLIWICLSSVLVMRVTSRTFVNPATVMLVNDCAPSPHLLGTVNGVASSISSAARILGPTVGGAMLGWGLSHNFVGLPLWVLAMIAMVNWIALLLIEHVKM